MEKVKPLIFAFLVFQIVAFSASGQGLSGAGGNQALIRIAEPGQLVDTLNIWGDVGTTGRYLIPEGTTVLELVSYAGGFGGGRSRRTGDSPWAKINVRITVSRYNENREREIRKHFSLRYNKPVSEEFRHFELNNEDVVALEVRQQPGFLDVVSVVGTILGTATTTFFFYDRILR